MDKYIAIFSVPRSGSTWLGQILNSSPSVAYRFQPNFAYSFPFQLNQNSSTLDIKEFHEKLLKTKDPFVTGKISISGNKNIKFPKTNITTLVWKETHFIFLAETLLKNSDTIVIGLIRSPFSVIYSWLKTPKEFNPNWDIEKEWKDAPIKNSNKKSHYFGYNKWKETAFLYLRLKKEYPNQFYIINYNHLLQDTLSKTKDIYKTLNIKFTNQTEDFITQSKSLNSKDAYSVFKVKENDNSWQGNLPQYIVEEIMNDKDFIKLNSHFKWI